MTNQRQILVLDDDPAIGQLVCRVARRAGMNARFCTQANRFFAELRHWQPTHVFLDLIMPGLDGVQVLKALADEGIKANIILTSGLDSRVLRSAERSARTHGLAMVGVLPKPFSRSALRAMLDTEAADLHARYVDCKNPPLEDAELDRALALGEFVVAYQPKWLLKRQRVLGFEALVRWHHPELGIVYPDRFIAHAERSGRIDALTEQVMKSSLAWISSIGIESEPKLEVNISGTSLGAVSPDRISSICAQSGVPSRRVVLEVTETSEVTNIPQATDVLNRLRIKGFGLAIDDYGVGYSSMAQLAMFPFTELKIDRMFIEQLTRSSEMRAIVSSTIRLARDMKLTTVAEGVEDEATLSLLTEMGCDAVQGYLIARPMYAEQARTWLSEHVTNEA